jgi:hypothetical protein
MKTSHLALALGLAALLSAPLRAGEKAKEYTQVAFVSVSANAELTADPGKVWKQLIRKDVLVKAVGMEEATGDENMGEPGAKLCGRLGGEPGNLVVTYSMIENEIRYAWEPDHGGYVCHMSLKLAPAGKGTKVTLMDSYSEEKPGMLDKNAKESRAHLAQSLETLKKAIVL